jgi:hypothetical protein
LLSVATGVRITAIVGLPVGLGVGLGEVVGVGVGPGAIGGFELLDPLSPPHAAVVMSKASAIADP